MTDEQAANLAKLVADGALSDVDVQNIRAADEAHRKSLESAPEPVAQ